MNRAALSGARIAASCAAVAAALMAWPCPGEATVLVVTSDELSQYETSIDAFESALDRPTLRVNVGEDAERTLRAAADGHRIDALFALGGQATHLGRQVFPDAPMVFAMVLDWNRYEFSEQTAGVALEMPVDVLFTRFKLLLPDLERVGVIYGEKTSAESLEAARAAARALGLDLVEEDVRYADEVPGAYRRMRTEVDALWMFPDPIVVTRDNFRYLRDHTRKDGIAFLAFSENFVRAGALLSIAPSYATMGSQAAVLLERLRTGAAIGRRVQAPLGSTVTVNAATARRVGLELEPALLVAADRLVDARD